MRGGERRLGKGVSQLVAYGSSLLLGGSGGFSGTP
jgi:hypothetical protein